MANESEGTFVSIKETFRSVECKEFLEFPNSPTPNTTSELSEDSTEKTASCVFSLEAMRSELELVHSERSSGGGSPTGHLGNLTFDQHKTLIALWGMLLEYLQQPYDQKKAAKKDKYLAAMLYEQSLSTASSTSSLVESELSAISSGRSSAIQANPLSTEFWCQAGTGDLDVLLLRFLRARKWDLNEAFSMLKDALEWRKMYGVREMMMEGEQAIKKDLLTSGKSFFWNVDAHGRLVTVITGRLHDKYAQTLEETCKFTVYQMEMGRRLMQAPSETVTVIFDMADAPMSSLDLGSIQFMVQCFQSFYPESLGKCLIMNPPWIFSGFFRMVKPLLDPVVAAKIEMVAPGEEMFKFIPRENLLKRFGGDSEYQYDYKDGTGEAIKPLSDKDIIQIEIELQDLQTRLIDITISLNSMFIHAEQLELTVDDPTIAALMEHRDQLKHEVSARWAMLDADRTPKSHYHRMGIISDAGKVDWNNHK